MRHYRTPLSISFLGKLLGKQLWMILQVLCRTSASVHGGSSMDWTSSDWVWGTLEARSMPWAHNLQASPEQLGCGSVHCLAGGYAAIGECLCHEGMDLVYSGFWAGGACQMAITWMSEQKVSQQNIVTRWSMLFTSLFIHLLMLWLIGVKKCNSGSISCCPEHGNFTCTCILICIVIFFHVQQSTFFF